MTDRLAYVLESAAWFVGGGLVSSIWWRFYYHRWLVRAGRARREMPLNLFVAAIVFMTLLLSLLWDEASRLKFDDAQRQFRDYVHCQARVNQANVSIENDTRRRSIDALRAQSRLYQAQEDTLLHPSPHLVEQLIAELDQARTTNNHRIYSLTHSKLQPATGCSRKGHRK